MSEGQRRAALLLHSVAAEDRQWVLQQLPTDDRDNLQKLIAEASELGLQSDPLFVEQNLGTVVAQTAALGPRDLEARLRAASSKSMLDLLLNEPAETTAMLCVGKDWPWSGDVLRSFGESKRRVVELLMSRGTVPPRLYAALLEEACARLPPEAKQQRGNTLRSGLKKLTLRVTRRLKRAAV